MPREAAHKESTASLDVDPHPPRCITMALPSLESFHPRRSSRPVDNTKLTQREASHFITTAITAKEDGSKEEEEKGPEEGIGYYNTLNLCFSKVGFKLISFNQFLHFLRKILMIYTNPKMKCNVETLNFCIHATSHFPLFALSVLRLCLK